MYKRILVPLDGSGLAEQALPHAVDQAGCFQAELILLRVLEPLPRYSNPSLSAVRQAEQVTESLARKYLERLAADVRESGIPVQVVTIAGSTHKTIVQFAEENRVDLIVVSSRGRSGASRWLMGTVADRVVRGASTAVLVVRAGTAGMGSV
jgi:nucleotide-binding universal stress UspA family protein